jgi:hypothetical protein
VTSCTTDLTVFVTSDVSDADATGTQSSEAIETMPATEIPQRKEWPELRPGSLVRLRVMVFPAPPLDFSDYPIFGHIYRLIG